MPRNVSASGKIAPSIADHATMRRRFMARIVNKSSALKRTLPINAPAIPCVMVSMNVRLIILIYRVDDARLLRGRNSRRSFYKDERRELRNDPANLANFDAVARQRCDAVGGKIRSDGDEEATGCLRIEE